MFSAVGNVRCNLVSSVDTKVLPPGKKRSFRLDSGNPGSERENDREKTAFFGVVKPGIRDFFPIPGADVCLCGGGKIVFSPPNFLFSSEEESIEWLKGRRCE